MYVLGVILGVLAGLAHNVGLLLQKRAVNQLEAGRRSAGFFSHLLNRPLWWTGFVIQAVIGASSLLLAQLLVGPALLPGLMASGLIVLAVGSDIIVHEPLRPAEILGIVLMIAAVTLLGFSRLAINIQNQNLLNPGFLLRSGAFTGGVLLLVLGLEVAQRLWKRYRGLLLAIVSGSLLSLSNFWTSPLMGLVVKLFRHQLTLPTKLMLAVLSALLILVNIFGIGRIQSAFRTSRASQAVPFQQVPLQLAPPVLFLLVFQHTAPSPQALPFLGVGIGLIIACSFLLAGRHTHVQEIQGGPLPPREDPQSEDRT